MDKETRNRIQRAAQDTRALLEREYAEQLEGIFDIRPDGTIATQPGSHLDAEQRVLRTKLVAGVEHLRAGGLKNAEAVAAYLREVAFTTLNRFVALKMLEARSLVQECISRGEQSSGFKEFTGLAPGLVQLPDHGYRLYIESLFDEIAREVRVLFDRLDLASLLWPRRSALAAMLSILNVVELAEVWKEDETIGWFYQYFNPPEERKAMRDASQAPRNSRELAVRNQFFTPRYVVEFLTDNTLGRIWYEMRKGDTALKGGCRYLVRRPNEVFLASGEKAPAGQENETDLSQELMLKKQVYVEHRPKKDPREIRILDPACGSGHFLLYCFDLLGRIYEESWCDPELGPGLWAALDFSLEVDERASDKVADPRSVHRGREVAPHCFRCGRVATRFIVADLYKTLWLAGRPMTYCDECDAEMKDSIRLSIPVESFSYSEALKSGWFTNSTGTIFLELAKCFDYRMGGPREGMFEKLEQAAQDENLQRLRQAVPKLIIERNIHGIDIDPRAVQIAALALWLRAQKTCKNIGIKAAEQPRIDRSNIVTAEPMPGEEDMRREFTAGLKPRVLGQLVDVVFDKMKLAGEAGSLLKIEEEIKDAVIEARKQWLEGPKPEQQLLFPGTADLRPDQQELRFDVSGVTDERFWEQAEDRILDALKDYAERAENGHVVRRRLFAEDSARGFAFINLCRKRYDVVLMNPPFGEPSTQSTELLKTDYNSSKSDIDAAFVDRAVGLLAVGGMVGGIYNRTQFFKSYLENWRDRNLIRDRQIIGCIDLGLGVLDGAMVEAAAYVTSRTETGLPAVFVSALSHTDKESAISQALERLHQSSTSNNLRILQPNTFAGIPGHRISYWVAPRLLKAFASHPQLEGKLGYARQGLITSDNDRFLRLVWEIPPCSIAQSLVETSQKRTEAEKGRRIWVFYAKGGDYSPFFGDVHLVVNWGRDGEEIRNFFRNGSLASRPQNLSFYFRRALTYTERTASDISPRAMPDGCIFDCKGPIIAAKDETIDLLALLALTNTKVFKYFVELSLAGGDTSVSVGAARQFTQSIVGTVPVPEGFKERQAELSQYSIRIWEAMAQDDSRLEESRLFSAPHGYPISSNLEIGLRALAREVDAARDAKHLTVLDATWQLHTAVIDLYSLDEDAVADVEDVVGKHPNKLFANHFSNLQESEQFRYLTEGFEKLIGELVLAGHTSRAITKMSYYADRRLEMLASAFKSRPNVIIEVKHKLGAVEDERFHESADVLVSYAIGAAFGRWDIRFATGEKPAPEFPDPFTPLLICPPGQLQSERGLPITKEEVESLKVKGRWNYPIEIPWDGILVDDPGFNRSQPHRDDIVRHARGVLDLLWKDKAHEIEQDACDILGVSDLRDYFRNPSGFFRDHLKRYSKSRRKAPIYWPLSTASGSYTLWLYYHRFTKDTFYKVLGDYITPKLQHEERKLTDLVQAAGSTPTVSHRKDIVDQEAFIEELRTFREAVVLIAPLWNPDLDDGVIINFAPLWRLLPHHRAWQRECKACWDKLVAGEYDWSHLAMHLWPERVIPKCAEDRSLAIAHDLEDVFWFEGTDGKWKPKEVAEDAIDHLIAERTSPAVREALKSLLGAPATAIGSRSLTTKRQSKTANRKRRYRVSTDE